MRRLRFLSALRRRLRHRRRLNDSIRQGTALFLLEDEQAGLARHAHNVLQHGDCIAIDLRHCDAHVGHALVGRGLNPPVRHERELLAVLNLGWCAPL